MAELEAMPSKLSDREVKEIGDQLEKMMSNASRRYREREDAMGWRGVGRE
jgi:hypothetical protein